MKLEMDAEFTASPIESGDGIVMNVDMIETKIGNRNHSKDSISVLRFPNCVRVAMLGPKPSSPAPTVLVFAIDAENTLQDPAYGEVASILHKSGYLCVSMDMPCHGEDTVRGEIEQLDGWHSRLINGRDIASEFVQKASAVLDALINEGYTRPDQIAVCGTSRGGLLAFTLAASDNRIKCAAAFSPITDLTFLHEFSDLSNKKIPQSMSWQQLATSLESKPVFICIGSQDERVGTDNAVAFSREIIRVASQEDAEPQVDLHILPSQGHHTPANAHQMAADWIIKTVSGSQPATLARKRIIDISFPVIPGADPERPFDISRSLLADDSYKFDITNTHTHVGSHVECSSHFFDDGCSVDQYPLDAFYGHGILFHVDIEDRLIMGHHVEAAIGDVVRTGDIVVCRNARPEGLENKRFFTPDAARYFRDKEVKMIVFGPNVSLGQNILDGRALHEILMRKTTFLEIVANLDQISKPEFEVMALPILVKGLDSAWCRAIIIEEV